MTVAAFLVFVSVIVAAMLVAVVVLAVNFSASRTGPGRMGSSAIQSIVAVVGAGAGLAVYQQQSQAWPVCELLQSTSEIVSVRMMPMLFQS